MSDRSQRDRKTTPFKVGMGQVYRARSCLLLLPYAFWLCLALVFPLTAQTNSIPWDILGGRTIVTPFLAGGDLNAKLAPNGDVFLSANPCGAPGIVKLISVYGNPAPCDTVISRLNSAGNSVFAIPGAESSGPVPDHRLHDSVIRHIAATRISGRQSRWRLSRS
jgi:hypothetical protein